MKVVVLWMAALVVSALLWMAVTKQRAIAEVSYSKFLDSVEAGEVGHVLIHPDFTIDAAYRDRKGGFRTIAPQNDPDLYAALREMEVEIVVENSPSWASIGLSSLPFLLLLSFWFYMMNAMRKRRP